MLQTFSIFFNMSKSSTEPISYPKIQRRQHLQTDLEKWLSLGTPEKQNSEVDPKLIGIFTRASDVHDECYKKSRGVILIEPVKYLMDEEGNRSKVIQIIVLSVLVLAWSISLESSTTSNHEFYATSTYGHHTLISTLRIATKIINAVGFCKIFRCNFKSYHLTSCLIVICFWVYYYSFWIVNLIFYSW